MHTSPLTILLTGMLFLLPCSGKAQTLGLSLTDESGTPIAYTTVFLPALQRGLITNDRGTFALTFTEATDTTSILFSAVGYETLRTDYQQATQRAAADKPIILTKKVYTLSQIEVSEQRLELKQKRLGLPGVLNATFQQSTRSTPMVFEAGPIIRPEKRCRLDAVELKVKQMDADTVLMDVNVYALNGRKVGEQLLRERLFVSVAREEVGRKVTVDLTSQNLWIDGDFLLTFRLLDVVGDEGVFAFKAKTGSRHGFVRRDNGEWERFYLIPALFARVSYEK